MFLIIVFNICTHWSISKLVWYCVGCPAAKFSLSELNKANNKMIIPDALFCPSAKTIATTADTRNVQDKTNWLSKLLATKTQTFSIRLQKLFVICPGCSRTTPQKCCPENGIWVGTREQFMNPATRCLCTFHVLSLTANQNVFKCISGRKTHHICSSQPT